VEEGKGLGRGKEREEIEGKGKERRMLGEERREVQREERRGGNERRKVSWGSIASCSQEGKDATGMATYIIA
jgi:hypothetical protein